MEARILSAILTGFSFVLVEGVIIGDVISNSLDAKFVVRIVDARWVVEPYSFAGAVISNRYVLTAAACVKNRPCDKLKIFPSYWMSDSTTHVPGSSCYFSGPYHGYRPFFFDLALIKTASDLLPDAGYEAIALPPPETKYPTGYASRLASRAIIYGWSGKNSSGSENDQLRKTTAYIRDSYDCTLVYRSFIGCEDDDTPIIPNKSFCLAGDLDPLGIPCKGDVGGPVLIDNKLAGIMNAWVIDVDGNCKDPSPTELVASNVVEHLAFIRATAFPDLDSNVRTVAEMRWDEERQLVVVHY